MSVTDCYHYLNTTNWHRVAIFVFFALLAVGYGVGFGVVSSDAKRKADDDFQQRLVLFTEWQMKVTSHFARAGSLAASIAAFASSYATVPMNFSAPPEDRVVTINNDAYLRLCRGLFEEVPGITTLEIQSGGVISQIYPVGYFPIGMDIMNLNEDQGYGELLRTGKPITAGPAKIFTGEYGIFLRYPVYVSDNRTNATFWGTGNVVMLIMDLLNALNISTLPNDLGTDYAGWYITERWGTVDILATTDESKTHIIMEQGMRMQLPVAEPGKVAYLALYPKSGPVEATIKGSTMALIIVLSFVGAALVVVSVYLMLYLHFMHRHRHAPNGKGDVFMAAITLRGAQPIADGDAQEAVRLFTEFTGTVRALCRQYRCYPVCEIGDRCVYVVSSDAEQLVLLAQFVAGHVALDCRARAPQMALNNDANRNKDALTYSLYGRTVSGLDVQTVGHGTTRGNNAASTSHAGSVSPFAQTPMSPSEGDASTRVSNEHSTAFLGSLTCHVSAACHASTTIPTAYDALRDVYFYGSAQQLSVLGSAADQASAGEVAWTEAFEAACDVSEVGEAMIEEPMNSTDNKADRGAKVLVGRWGRGMENNEKRCAEDPSTAMAIVGDVYLKRMCATAGDKSLKKHSKRGANADKRESGQTVKSNKDSKEIAASTAISRNATILHIGFCTTDPQGVLDLIRRAVIEEKGAVVSAHSQTVVAAFNLLSPGGHHQLRAAEVVARLRAELATTPFVCSLTSGVVKAVVVDEMALCTGEAVTTGSALLTRAMGLARFDQLASGRVDFVPLGAPQQPEGRHLTSLSSSKDDTEGDEDALESDRTFLAVSSSIKDSAAHGLCLLYDYNAVHLAFEAEVIDIMVATGHRASRALFGAIEAPCGAERPRRLLYRLCERRQNERTDDEWMYQLQHCEGKSQFGPGNALFLQIAEGKLGDQVISLQPDGSLSLVEKSTMTPVGGEEEGAAMGRTMSGYAMSRFAKSALARFASAKVTI